MADIDNYLFDTNTLDSDRSENRRKKKGLKSKAESQFVKSAQPVSLKSFFSSIMDITEDEPELNFSANFEQETAPMLTEVPTYFENCEEQSGQLVHVANQFLDLLDAQDKLEDSEQFQDSRSVNSTLDDLNLDNLMKDVNTDVIQKRVESKSLTAKRIAFKALQCFTFSEHYTKHFNSDVNYIRSINTEMLIDKSPQSLNHLHHCAQKYLDNYKTLFGFTFHENFILKMQVANKCFKPLGFSALLNNISLDDLKTPDKPISSIDLSTTNYYHITLNEMLHYFGFMLIDDLPCQTELKHLNVIMNYYPPRKRIFYKDLFKSEEVVDERITGSFDPKHINF
jgi:hypothetical protein